MSLFFKLAQEFMRIIRDDIQTRRKGVAPEAAIESAIIRRRTCPRPAGGSKTN